MSSVEQNCLDPGDPCSLSPSVLSSLASSLGVTQTVTATSTPQRSGPILTVGAEVGIAVGAVSVVVVVGLLSVLLRRGRRRGKHVVEIDLSDPPSPAMVEASLPHFPRLPGESTTSLVPNTGTWDAGRVSGRREGPSNGQPGLGSSKRQAAREARNQGRPGVGRGGGASAADSPAQPVQYETDGGVRLAGGRLGPPRSEHGDDECGGSNEAGTVPPPPYAAY